ncbi:hypothetical protein [Radiobacillus sp. PE A8.2]|uniref:hypothetical protein n=1 Tax=Radiobacillus sp. PE A8.2 TaxID=3380349 RepID=UPI00388DC504
MNFESKYLIRYGIPGWIFLIWIALHLFIAGKITISDDIEPIKVISSLVLVISLGVVIGYVFYQSYFTLVWVLKTNNNFINRTLKSVEKKKIKLPEDFNERNFLIEFLWHSHILKLEEYKLSYLSQQYEYLSNRKHELGSLLVTLTFCCLVTGISLFFGFNIYLIAMLLASGITLFTTYRSFAYYSENLDYFTAKVIDEV